MRTLLLFRHGKSDWDTGAVDLERPLKGKGKRAAKRMGRWLAGAGELPDLALSSPARRARDTLRRAHRAGDWDCPVEIRDALYVFDGEDLLTFLQGFDQPVRRLLITGHQPALGELAAILVGGGRLRLPTAALARIDLAIDGWAGARPGCGELRWLVPPRVLARIFHLPNNARSPRG